MRAPARDDVDVVMFAGPTLAASPRARGRLARGLRLRRPVRRRDVEGAGRRGERPGSSFSSTAFSTTHSRWGTREIRDALARGWSVWGLSSMGAIRAREMAHLGVRGYGRVFERFCQGDDFQDDEVALLHEATSPYRAVSEPLFHLREAVAHLARGGLVADETRESSSRTSSRAGTASAPCAARPSGWRAGCRRPRPPSEVSSRTSIASARRHWIWNGSSRSVRGARGSRPVVERCE